MSRRVAAWGSAAALMLTVLLVASPPAGARVMGSTCGTTASISLDPTSGEAGTVVTLTGTGFCPDTSAVVQFRDSTGARFSLGTAPVNPDGTLSLVIGVPLDAEAGTAAVRAIDRASHQCPWAWFEVTSPG
jgi:hypothetical protein